MARHPEQHEQNYDSEGGYKSVCIISTSWEKLETVYSSQSLEGEGKGVHSAQEKPIKQLWLIACLLSHTQNE